MDDVTMPGGTPPSPPTAPRSARLSESEFKEWAARPGAVVFDLQYRGLEIEDKENFPALTSVITFAQTSFIRNLGIPKKGFAQFSVPPLVNSPEGAIEYEGKTAKALFLDLDCDGKVGPDEKLSPILSPKEKDESYHFLSPNFTFDSARGGKIRYRVLASAKYYGETPKVNLTCFCLWEGEAKVGDTLTTLRLMDNNFNGSFSDFIPNTSFGTDTFQLATGPLSQFKNTPVPSERLSSLVQLNKTFYQLRLSGEGSKEKPLRAVLWKDPSPSGKLTVQQAQGPEMKIRQATLASIEMSSARFEINGPDTEIPEGRYRIESAHLTFGPRETTRVTLQNLPECRIVGGRTTPLELPKPNKVKLDAIIDDQRYSTSVTPLTYFPQNTTVYLTARVIGAQGEDYHDFQERSADGKSPVPQKEPHLQILTPDGQEIVSTDIKLGNDSFCGYSWDTQRLAPGRYPVKLTCDTGGFAGEIKTECALTLTELKETPPAQPALLPEAEFTKWAAQTGAVVFDFRFRGLTEKELNATWAYHGDGSTPRETPFTKSLNISKGKSAPFRLPFLQGAEDGILEYEGKKAQAIYLDLNGDGQLNPGEKLEPVQNPEGETHPCFFITPDFETTAPTGKKTPYRVVIRVDWSEGPGGAKPSVMFAPFCLWEADLNLENKAIALRLVDVDFDGFFLNFGNDSLDSRGVAGNDRSVDLSPGDTLSTLIRLRPLSSYAGYQGRFTGEGTKEKPWRGAICKDPRPTGEVEVRLLQPNPDAQIQTVRLSDSEMPSSQFDLHAATKLPQGRYRIVSGNLKFGKDSPGSASFKGGPECTIVAGQKVTVELGHPKLTIEALEKAEPYQPPVTANASFPAGTEVYLPVKLVGAQGEAYNSVLVQAEGGGSSVPTPKPHLQILGPDGKEVASADLEYG
jgi:hypothetical protein